MMAKYDTRQRSRAAPKGGAVRLFTQFTLILISFVCGYGFTSVYDYAHLNAFFHANILAEHPTSSIIKNTNNTAALPKPKFEFYTLLAEGVPAPKAVEPVSAAPASAQSVAASVAVTAQPVDLKTKVVEATPVILPKPVMVAPAAAGVIHQYSASTETYLD